MFKNINSLIRGLKYGECVFSVAKCRKCDFHTSFTKKLNKKLDEPTNDARKKGIKSTLYYGAAAVVVTAGLSYAAVPLYRMFCQAYSYGGTTAVGHDSSKVETMSPVRHKPIKIKFNADTAASIRWNFKPQQTEITVFPGETALAFYTAMNPTDTPVVGISTYNVVPFEAGQYFNKIQCFCFEEQMLNPKEQVDMPVFFYIDPEIMEDPYMEFVNEITLSYTFFEAKDGLKLPMPSYAR
ncbi:hypothetical protein NQ318_004293 [Aromia moschata]|uniref:Cytochrome c oxidase assembly protein COX11, mitochondrial n=1 Tax=Aromia moschata TaxID=1265417 RepID=A0AAV8YPZ8_9CUCU|nr:hypothetical protein NQ318_004293 [Aromia moschata]